MNGPAARSIVLESERSAESARVTVADSGVGIPEEKLRTVFEPFYTTKEQGTGLGLPIARTIIETYGGTITARNKPEGHGALFSFILPLARSTAGRKAEPTPPST
jgi:signal transduction histidine kinase